ncbi:MAG: aldo/keto reductase [Lachnospiraceae bacterium]|nr:aldo/keto reductase [Lachnospiraceae bacterium]
MMTKYTDMLCLTPEFLEYHKASQMTVMSYMSMNNGYFQKRIKNQPLNPFNERMYGNETNERILKKLREMDAEGIDLTAVMFQYIMNYGIPVTALFGFSRVSQLEELIKASETVVPEEDLRDLYQNPGRTPLPLSAA